MPSSPASFAGRRLLALSYLRVAVIVVFVAVLPAVAYLKHDADVKHREDRVQRIAGCDRTNVLRSVVDGLLTTARSRATSQGQPGYADEYLDLRATLRAVPFTRPGSSEVECDRANP